MLPTSKQPTPKLNKYLSVKRENSLQSKLVVTSQHDTLSLLGEKSHRILFGSISRQVPEAREGIRARSRIEAQPHCR